VRSAYIAEVVTLAAITLTGCGNSAEPVSSSATAALELHEIVSTTSGVSGMAFSVDITSGTTAIFSTTGVLAVPELHGYRSDSAGLDGAGLEPLADVWLESGQHYESIDETTVKPTHGGLASFLSINDPRDPASLLEVLDHWLGSADPQHPTQETIDGIVTTHFTLDRTDRTPLEIWVDSGQRLVRVVEVGDQLRPLTSTYFFEYPASVAVPVRP